MKEINEDTFKIQKVNGVTFSDKYMTNGEEYGTCSNCNMETPIVGHICMTQLEDMPTTIQQFKEQNYVELNNLGWINQAYNQQHIKYHRGFFKKLVDKANKNRRLSKKEYEQLRYLLNNGRSMYEDGILTTKN